MSGSWFVTHRDGKPFHLDEALCIWDVEAFARDQHITRMVGHVPYPRWARIVEQKTGRVMAEWKAGLFQFFGPPSGAR